MAELIIIIQAILAGFLGTVALLEVKSRRIKFVALAALYLLIISIAWGQINLQLETDWRSKYDGILESPYVSTSTNPAIAFGGTTLNWGGAPNTPQITFNDGGFIMVNLINGEAVLTTQIRDSNGDLIGKIDDNHWYIYSPQFIVDRNFTDNSLEILDLKGNPTFQVQIEGNTVHIAGYYYKQEGGLPDFIGPWINNPLFVYPSVYHRGEFNSEASSSQSGGEFILRH